MIFDSFWPDFLRDLIGSFTHATLAPLRRPLVVNYLIHVISKQDSESNYLFDNTATVSWTQAHTEAQGFNRHLQLLRNLARRALAGVSTDSWFSRCFSGVLPGLLAGYWRQIFRQCLSLH